MVRVADAVKVPISQQSADLSMHPDAGAGRVGAADRRKGTSAAWIVADLLKFRRRQSNRRRQGVASEYFGGVVVSVCNDEPGGEIDV